MSALSDALNEANVDGWSSREIARRAGDRIHFGTVSDYLKGNHGKPSEPVLLVLAEVLKVPVTKLREAAALPPGEADSTEPAAEWRRLDRRQQRAVNEIIRLLAEPKAGDGDVSRDAAPIVALRTAARRTDQEPGNPEVNRAGREAEESQDPGGMDPA